MKIWFWFLKENKELYAWTNNKELRKSFNEDRRNDLFIEKVEKYDDDSDEVMELYTDYPSEFLNKYEFKTLIDGDKLMYIPKVITGREKLDVINISYRIYTVDVITYAVIPMKCFSNNMKKSLENLGYNDAYKTYAVTKKKDNKGFNIPITDNDDVNAKLINHIRRNSFYGLGQDIKVNEYHQFGGPPSLFKDELSTFIHIYGDTLKESEDLV